MMKLVFALSVVVSPASAFTLAPPSCHTQQSSSITSESHAFHSSVLHVQSPAWVLRSAKADDSTANDPVSEESDGAPETSDAANSDTDLTDEDWSIVDQVLTGFPDAVPLEDRVAAAMGGMHPRLVMALRSAADSSGDDVEDSSSAQKLREVGKAMSSLLDGRLKDGRDLLASLLTSGEIRKLDGLIGRAAKDGKLDMAFFSVLNMNIRDAAYEASRMSPEEQAKLEETRVSVPTNDESGTAGRLQILQHIYTRCQEEVEKTVAPGAGLLNKLLRTDAAGIRSNQLKHYLGPQSNTVKTPDGKEIQLEGTGKPLVPLQEFVEAVGNTVMQIRTVERAGGTSRETAADLVESVRQIAIEGRFAIAEVYGTDSSELKQFEDGLQPVFRPGTANSEYIKGN